ncbi:MAG: metallophosphoesterase [Sporichthyaceae bacterium]
MGTTATLTIATAVAGLAGAGAVVAVPRRFGPVVAVVAGLALAAAVLVLALFVLVGGGSLGYFGVVHLAYLGAVLAVPLVGTGAVTRGVLTRSRAAVVLAVVLGLPAPIGYYATNVEPYRLRVDRAQVAVAVDRAGSEPIRIGVLADLQTFAPGGYESRAIDTLLAQRPDVILVAGDLLQAGEAHFAAHLGELRALLTRLVAPGGVYVVRGDADPGDYTDRAFRGTGATILDDRAVLVKVKDRVLRIGGNRLFYSGPAAVAMRRDLAALPEDGSIRIVLAHRPDAVLDLAPSSRIDLTVAGHTHGGQVVIPGFGPPVTLTSVPRKVARGGLHRVENNQVYVSTGVGLERGQAPQVRLFSRPSIGVLDVEG